MISLVTTGGRRRAVLLPLPMMLRALGLLAPLVVALLALVGATQSARALNLDSGSGSLLLRAPDADPVEAPRLKADVTVDVSGPTARSTVTQAFRNTTEHWVEGTYLYPLPEDAAVDTMKLVIGDRVIVADIKEREQAKREYEAAKREGKAAALTEQQRPNLFTNAVANIGPGETVLVQIEFQQKVKLSSGTHSLRLPLVAAPRYKPAPPIVDLASDGGLVVGADPVPDAKRITAPVLDPATNAPVNPLTLTIRLQAGFPLASVKSATHAIRVEEKGEQERIVTLTEGATAADRDFELTWTQVPGAAPAVGLFKEHVGGQDVVLAVLTPPEGTKPVERAARDVTFVIDNSGSMGGASMRQAKAGLLIALDRLQPGDRFNVIRFDDTWERIFPASVAADETHLDIAKAFVAKLEARGGTEMLEPLKAALQDTTPDDGTRLRQIVFMTDGAIGNEKEIFSAIADGRGRSRVFMVGIGSAPNSHLMTHASELGRGTFTQIGSIDQVTDRMRELFVKLESPAVTDLSATFSEGGVDVTPAMMPDLYRGEPLMLAARMSEAKGTLTIRGKIGGEPWESVLQLDRAGAGKGIGKVWARAKIDDAETARITGRFGPDAADSAILKLALEHKLMTRLTSLVAVDKTPRRPAGARLAETELPLNLPAGWEFEKVFGPAGDAPRGPIQRRADAAKVQHAAATRALELPQTATDAGVNLLVGLMLLVLGLFHGGLLLGARARRLG